MLNNPVLHKEIMRMRLRQPRPAQIAIISAVILGVAYLYWTAMRYLVFDQHWGGAGSSIWVTTVILQFLIIGLLAPSTTANTISQEREQQTWEMLLQTRLTAREIIFGKLFARLIPILAIFALGFPISTLAMLRSNSESGYYQISLGLYLTANLGMLVMGVFFATFALYMSMRLKRTLYALVASYAFIAGGLAIGTTLITGTFEMFNRYDSHFMDTFPLMWINPVYIGAGIVSHPNFNSNNYSTDCLPYAILGLVLYAGATVLLLHRLVRNFRRFAYDG